jgi:hypothetical protein
MNYFEELKGVVKLPDYANCSMIDFARNIRVLIEIEQRKINPDNALIDTLCNAARIGWELLHTKERANIPATGQSAPCPHLFKGTDGVHCVIVNQCNHPDVGKW